MTQLEKLKDIILSSKAKKWVTSANLLLGELVLTVKPEDITDILTFLRDDKKTQFQMLISISGVDYPQRLDRFEIVYNLLSLTLNHRIRVKLHAEENTLVPSITKLFSGSGWYEREIWDMFGVMFKGNVDLRRILTDYGFEGHPLRKDFPLTGHTEVRYDLAKKEVAYEKVYLTQEFRNFDFMSPWEGTNYVLPGDEKAT